jgi:hypothetical protein
VGGRQRARPGCGRLFVWILWRWWARCVVLVLMVLTRGVRRQRKRIGALGVRGGSGRMYMCCRVRGMLVVMVSWGCNDIDEQWYFSPLLAAKRRTLFDPAFIMCVMNAINVSSLSVPLSASDTPSLNPSHTSAAGSLENLAAGESARPSHALPHRAGKAKSHCIFNFCCRWLALPFSLQSHGTFLIIKGF